MHAAPVILKNRFGHEGDGLVISLGDIFTNVFVPHKLVGHFQQVRKLHIYFALAGGGNFMVMGFYDNADFAHFIYHFTTKIMIRVGWADREISPLKTGLVS